MKKTFSAVVFVILGAGVAMFAGFAFAQSLVVFPDVNSSDWFYEDVNNLVSWGVIEGNSDGTFRPGAYVNRAELSAMWNRYNTYLQTQFEAKFSNDFSTVDINTTSTPLVSKNIKLDEKDTINGVSLTVKPIQDVVLREYDTKPTTGNKYVSIEVFIENNSGKSIYLSASDFYIKDTNNYEYSSSYNIYMPTSLNSSNLENGKSLRGQIIFEVSKTAIFSELRYDINWGELGRFYVKM